MVELSWGRIKKNINCPSKTFHCEMLLVSGKHSDNGFRSMGCIMTGKPTPTQRCQTSGRIKVSQTDILVAVPFQCFLQYIRLYLNCHNGHSFYYAFILPPSRQGRISVRLMRPLSRSYCLIFSWVLRVYHWFWWAFDKYNSPSWLWVCAVRISWMTQSEIQDH